jgi:hypothetical protein
MVCGKKSKDSVRFKDQATEENIKKAVGDWLRLASQRDGGSNFKKYR